MKLTKKQLQKIVDIIENRYNSLLVALDGKDILGPKQLKELKDAGIDTSNTDSILEIIYKYNYLNTSLDKDRPKTLKAIKKQQETTKIPINPKAMALTLDKSRESIKSIVEDKKNKTHRAMLTALNEEREANMADNLKSIVNKESIKEAFEAESIDQIKRKLRASSSEANRDWGRVASTESSEIVGAASANKIAEANPDKDWDDIYVYRIIVEDAATCQWCKKFYQDSDGTPKIYKFTTLLANGSNYGKKKAAWLPVFGATHPNTRTSQIIEIRPGWSLKAGGNQEFIGNEAWAKYIKEKMKK